MWAGLESPVTIANYVVHMPRGGAIGSWLGGANAITGEEDMMRWIEQAIWASQSSKPKSVKPRDYPEGVHEREVRLEKLRMNARRFRTRNRH